MESGTQPILAAEIAAAFDWWREAGVDLDFADAPVRWLTPDEPEAPGAVAAPPLQTDSPPPQIVIGGSPDHWPADLESFKTWWLNEPSLDGGVVRMRVAPRGTRGAELMIIVPQPEDTDESELLSGPQGRALDAIIAAMGLAADQVYVASALPRHTPLADWAALRAQGLGSVLLHHIKLAAPQQVIVFGSNVLPLLSNDPAQSAKVLQSVNHEGRSIPLLGDRELGPLMSRATWKAGFWQRWLDWTGSKTA